MTKTHPYVQALGLQSKPEMIMEDIMSGALDPRFLGRKRQVGQVVGLAFLGW